MNSVGEKRVAASLGRFRLLRRLLVAAVAVCAVTVLAGRSTAQGVKYTDSQRKALMLYNFAMFTEWPKSAFAEDSGETKAGAPAGTLREFKDNAERAFLVGKLRENGWNISKTAEVIDTPRSNLYKKLEQYQIKPESDS